MAAVGPVRGKRQDTEQTAHAHHAADFLCTQLPWSHSSNSIVPSCGCSQKSSYPSEGRPSCEVSESKSALKYRFLSDKPKSE